MNNCPNLFTPIQIGNITVKNRLFMPPLSTNLGKKGYVTSDAGSVATLRDAISTGYEIARKI